MARHLIGQDMLVFASDARGRQSMLDGLLQLIHWTAVEQQLRDISSAPKDEPAWPLLALFKAMLIAVWHDLSDERLAEALDDRASFRRFSANIPRRNELPSCDCARSWSPVVSIRPCSTR